MSPSSIPTHIIRGGFGPIIDRTPTPFPFISNPDARTRAESRRETLCGAIRALCRCEPPRPIDVRALFPCSTHPVAANPSIVGETIPEEHTEPTPPLAAPTPTENFHAQHQPPALIPAALPPPQFNTGMLPYGQNPPVLTRLAREHTVFLVDSSCHMSERWSELAMSIARTTSVIRHAMQRSPLPPQDYPYVRRNNNETPPTLGLYFMDSDLKLRDISYPDTVLKAFESVAPRFDRAPLGGQLFNVVADTFPNPPHDQMPLSSRRALNLIVLTAGYITDDPLAGIESFRSVMDVLAIKDEQVTITLYQVGYNSGAANLLNSYEQVYNSWGSEGGRNLVHTEICEEDHHTTSVRSILRAMSRSMRSRGSI